MFGKKKNFLQVSKDIKDIKGVKCTTTEFCQGNTIRWGIAWTFNESIQFEQETKKRVKAKKAKPPLEYQILLKKTKNFHIDVVVKQAKIYLSSLQIPFKVLRSSQNFAELLLKSDENTWTHQRRKRRELERQKKGDDSTVSPSKASPVSLTHTPSEENHAEELSNVQIAIKSEPTVESSCRDEKGESSNSKCLRNVPIDLKTPEKTTLQHSTKSDCIGASNVLVHNKRKLSSEFTENKKFKLSTDENTNTLEGSEINVTIKTEVDTENNIPANDDATGVEKTPSKYESMKLKADPENISVKIEPVCEMSDSSSHVNTADDKKSDVPEPEGLVLNCTLQFIRGKDKIYVKMNCSPTADRSTMYQVFQLIKNKIY